MKKQVQNSIIWTAPGSWNLYLIISNMLIWDITLPFFWTHLTNLSMSRYLLQNAYYKEEKQHFSVFNIVIQWQKKHAGFFFLIGKTHS